MCLKCENNVKNKLKWKPFCRMWKKEKNLSKISSSEISLNIKEVKSTEQMPTNYCQYIWECPNCKNKLKPKEGDCCVYCSYGSVKCPTIQKGSCC